MKKGLFAVVLLISIYGRALGFPSMSNDSWYTWDAPTTADPYGTPTNPMVNNTVYSTQLASGYDPIGDKLYGFNGHNPGGSYPNPDDTMAFDVSAATGIWTSVRPIDSIVPPAS